MRTHLMHTHLLTTTAVAAALLAAPSSTRAQSNWTGTNSTNWFDAGNWQGGVPGPGSTTTIGDIVRPPAVVGAVGATTGPLIIGGAAGGQGTVTVTGAGILTENSFMNIGQVGGTGTLRIADGGTVNTSASATIGAGGTGTVIVDGGTWIDNAFINVGGSGTGATGTLTIANGGNVRIAGVVVEASGGGSSGTLNIGAAPGDPLAAPGMLTATFISSSAGIVTINFNHTATAYEFAVPILGKAPPSTCSRAPPPSRPPTPIPPRRT